MSGDVIVSPDVFEIPIVVDGEEVWVCAADLGSDASRLWQRHYGADPQLRNLFAAVSAAFVPFALHPHHYQGLVWLHRRFNGEPDLDLDDVAFDIADATATFAFQQKWLREREKAARDARIERVRGKGKGTTRSTSGNSKKPSTG